MMEKTAVVLMLVCVVMGVMEAKPVEDFLEDGELRALFKRSDLEDEEFLRALFKRSDLDRDGFIDTEELLVVMRMKHESTTEDEAAKEMKKVDMNGDGRIDLVELLKFVSRQSRMNEPVEGEILEDGEENRSMTCDDDIPENHMHAGNQRYRNCPRVAGSTCTVPRLDGNGVVVFKCPAGLWVTEEHIREGKEQFQSFDLNEDGFVDAGEFLRSVRKHDESMTEKVAARIMKNIDGDGDGRIDFAELMEFASRKVRG